ncbi:hypothetical protein EMCG_08340 [[Emmonsia] crescens]|uniref:Uncharacterized protein n=1 Tax=[Emmonsia] crescens TaxID=73230 RepID=A0A0G2I6U1_9EURO|nr:hypothetical protein EMCG_08340 [Emmonsia crescens UAMH 3008]
MDLTAKEILKIGFIQQLAIHDSQQRRWAIYTDRLNSTLLNMLRATFYPHDGDQDQEDQDAFSPHREHRYSQI